MTEKWADYAIVGVSYSDGGKHILKVKILEDTGERLTNEQIVARLNVVSLLDGGNTIITVYQKDGKWQKGDRVGIVEINRVKYIRTDGNKKEADNLGSLPTF
ncbi:MAG: DUF3892 domain-containing protein [Methanothrix sp.]